MCLVNKREVKEIFEITRTRTHARTFELEINHFEEFIFFIQRQFTISRALSFLEEFYILFQSISHDLPSLLLPSYIPPTSPTSTPGRCVSSKLRLNLKQ